MASLTDRIVSGAKVLTLKGLKYFADAIRGELDKKSPIGHKHDAGDVDSGTLSSERLPSIPESKLPVVPTSKGGTGTDLSDEAGGFVYVNDGSSPRTMDVIDGEGAIWYGFEASGTPDTTGAGPRAGLLPLQYGGTGKDLDMRFGFVYVDPSSEPVTMNSMTTKGVMQVNENGTPTSGIVPLEYGGFGNDVSQWGDLAIPIYRQSRDLVLPINAGTGVLQMVKPGSGGVPSTNPHWGTVPISMGGTGATNLSDAQDNLGIKELRDSLSQLIQVRRKRAATTAIAPSTTALIDVAPDAVSGYSVIGIVGATSMHGSALLQGFYLMNTSVGRVEVRNVGSGELSCSPVAVFLYLRD